MIKNQLALNSADTQVRHNIKLDLKKNAIVDEGDGVILFPNRLVITDNTEQFNGTKYDIRSLDLSEYDGMLTANHTMEIQEVIGKTFGVEKDANQVTIQGIRFAIKDNALARYAYNMILGGFLTDFSIETIGPMPNEEGVYFDSQLVGLSLVVMGNNKSAKVNEVKQNSIDQAHGDGLDTTIVENLFNAKGGEENKMFKTIKNHRKFSVVVKYKNAAGDEVEITLNAGDTVDVSEDQADEIKAQINDADKPDPKDGDDNDSDDDGDDDDSDGAGENQIKTISNAVSNAIKPLTKKVDELEQKVFDNSATEPKFKGTQNANKSKQINNRIKSMGWRERHGAQINAAWDSLKSGSQVAAKELIDLNTFNLEQLQEKDIVPNVMTIADFGNFVISPELLSEIEGHRSNFTPLISATEWRETLSQQMAYLKRSGDIDMEEVEFCDDGADGNLKPISEYTADITTKDMNELAAVTPVCNAATRFLATDMISDVTAGYRNDYDRKRAQLVIALMQQAIDTTGNTVVYNTTSDVNALVSWIEAWTLMQEEIMGGTFIFNQRTYGELLRRAIAAGISGPLSGLFTTGDQPMIAGSPYIVVPNELLPTLNTAETKTFVVGGANVTISHAVFYVDLQTFTGRTSGGLQFDLSTEAAYEVSQTVKSAFQRNELVLRGSFFRNGAIRDEDKVSALGAPGVS